MPQPKILAVAGQQTRATHTHPVLSLSLSVLPHEHPFYLHILTNTASSLFGWPSSGYFSWLSYWSASFPQPISLSMLLKSPFRWCEWLVGCNLEWRLKNWFATTMGLLLSLWLLVLVLVLFSSLCEIFTSLLSLARVVQWCGKLLQYDWLNSF
jgi:hypothetical protein